MYVCMCYPSPQSPFKQRTSLQRKAKMKHFAQHSYTHTSLGNDHFVGPLQDLLYEPQQQDHVSVTKGHIPTSPYVHLQKKLANFEQPEDTPYIPSLQCKDKTIVKQTSLCARNTCCHSSFLRRWSVFFRLPFLFRSLGTGRSNCLFVEEVRRRGFSAEHGVYRDCDTCFGLSVRGGRVWYLG